MRKADNQATLYLRVSPEIRRELLNRAHEWDRSMSEIVEAALADYFSAYAVGERDALDIVREEEERKA